MVKHIQHIKEMLPQMVEYILQINVYVLDGVLVTLIQVVFHPKLLSDFIIIDKFLKVLGIVLFSTNPPEGRLVRDLILETFSQICC